MINKITLDDNEFEFNESLLPCLVVGADKSGASYFSICLASNLIQSDLKVIFFTAFPMAKEELFKQIDKNDVIQINDDNDLAGALDEKTIVVKSGDVELLKKTIATINASNYIVFVKNIEQYDQSLFDLLEHQQRLIMSGDVDGCQFKERLIKKSWSSKIFFSKPVSGFKINIPELEKYEGYLIGQKQNGVLRLAK